MSPPDSGAGARGVSPAPESHVLPTPGDAPAAPGVGESGQVDIILLVLLVIVIVVLLTGVR